MEIGNANGLSFQRKINPGFLISVTFAYIYIYVCICVCVYIYLYPVLHFCFRKDSKLDLCSAPYLNVSHRQTCTQLTSC